VTDCETSAYYLTKIDAHCKVAFNGSGLARVICPRKNRLPKRAEIDMFCTKRTAEKQLPKRTIKSQSSVHHNVFSGGRTRPSTVKGKDVAFILGLACAGSSY